MLTIHIYDDSIKYIRDTRDFVYDVEKAFSEAIIPVTDKIKHVIMDIDHGEMIDSYSFKDRFGYKLRISEISTGAKAIILSLMMPDKLINFCEAGNNCRDWAILNMVDGRILINYPNTTIAYTKEDELKQIDVIVSGIRFRKVNRLVEYFRNEFAFIPSKEEVLRGDQK